MKQYRTSQIAKLMGIHPNTVRLYEEWGLIPIPQRQANGYRVFTEVHLEQIKLAKLALRGCVLQNGLRKLAITIIKTSAKGEYAKALSLTDQYRMKIGLEIKHAEEAVEIVQHMIEGEKEILESLRMSRKETADYLQVTIHTLRNWEMNGLVSVKRKENGYRIYNETDILWLKIIRTLRCADYSLTSILRMLTDLSHSTAIDVKSSLNCPKDHEEIINACDTLLTSLNHLNSDADFMCVQINKVRESDQDS